MFVAFVFTAAVALQYHLVIVVSKYVCLDTGPLNHEPGKLATTRAETPRELMINRLRASVLELEIVFFFFLSSFCRN